MFTNTRELMQEILESDHIETLQCTGKVSHEVSHLTGLHYVHTGEGGMVFYEKEAESARATYNWLVSSRAYKA